MIEEHVVCRAGNRGSGVEMEKGSMICVTHAIVIGFLFEIFNPKRMWILILIV